MRLSGSAPERPFPLAAALAVTAAGIVAMVGGSVWLASQPGLGLRPKIGLGTLLLALPGLFVLLLRPELWPAVRGARHVTGRMAALSLLLGAALWLGSAGLIEVQALALPPKPEYLEAFRALHRALAPDGPADALVSVLVIAVLPGLCEELVVRGIFLPSLVRRLGQGAWIAILISALLFAVIHLDAYRFLFTFVLGVIFGFLRLASGSLWSSVVAHTSLNTLTFAVAPFVDDPTQPYTPSPALGIACLVAGAAIAWPLLRALGTGALTPPAPVPRLGG